MMKAGGKILALIFFVFLAYLIIHLAQMREIGFNWLSPPQSREIFLMDYPKEVYGGGAFLVGSNFRADCTLCNATQVALADGANRVDFTASLCPGEVVLACGERSVSFNYSLLAARSQESLSASAETEVANRTLLVRVHGEGKSSGYHPLLILIDGKVAEAPLYRLDGAFSVEERIPVESGEHTVEVSYNGQNIYSGGFSVPSTFSLSALAAVLASLLAAFLVRERPVAKVAIAGVLLAASLVVGFELSKFGLDFLVPLALAGAAGYLYSRRGKRKETRGKASAEEGLLLDAARVGVAFAFFILLMNMFISTYDIWGAYYFRQAEETLAHGTTAYFDELSYLGRPFTYPPVFFEFGAQLARAAGSGFEGIRVPLDMLLAFSFASSSFLLFRNYGRAERLLAAFLFISQWAFLLTASGIGLHMLAFTLLNLSLLLVEASPIASIASLGLAFACHPIALVFFPFYLYAVNGFRLDLRRMVAWPALAAVLSLPFYIPIFMRAGLPYEIVPGQWGFLLSYGISGMMFDFQFLLPLFAATALFGLATPKYRFPSLLLLGLLLFNAFVSLRSDLIVAMLGAALFPAVFGKWLKDWRVVAALFALYILPNFILGAVVLSGTGYYCSWGLANEMCASPMEYISLYSPGSSRVAVDPVYGHVEAWIGRRAVLADLYVEYADLDKFKAENDFYSKGDESAFAHYGIDYAVVDATMRHSASGDRVYDNAYIQVFRRNGG